MENKKKLGLEILFLVAVFAATMYGVFHGENINEIIEIIKRVQKIYLLPAVICVLLFVWGESIIIRYMMGTLNIRVRKWTCFLFSSVGFFFSCITPSASGGQPAQILYMRRENIPIPISTLVLMIVTITYKAVLVIAGIAILIFGQGFIHDYLDGIVPVFYLGIFLNVACVSFMLIMVYNTTFAGNILNSGLSFLEKTRVVRYKERRHKRLEAGIKKYGETAVYFKNHYHVVIHVLLITFAQRFALFLSTYFVYKAFGLEGFSALTIVILQAVISISVDMLPLPGGMGITEKLFLTIFAPVFGTTLLLPGMVLCRGLSYYTQLFMCAILTVLAHFTIGRKGSVVEENQKEKL